MREHATGTRLGSVRLCDFLRVHQSTIIAEWSERARALPAAKDLSKVALMDHLPDILARITKIVAAVHSGATATLADTPKVHAVDRLAQGFDLDAVLEEYALLRRTIFELWERNVGPTIDLAESTQLDHAIDQAIGETAVRFAKGRERVLRALDRISEAALGTADLDTFLGKLARAVLECTEAVDSAVVLLREGDRLRVRAGVGLEENLSANATIRVGEGFAGRIAAEARPLFVPRAAADAVIANDAMPPGVRALYGVPLVHAGDVIGVTYIGSRSAFEFSEDDKLLFQTMASRATSVVVQAQLVAENQRARAREEAARAEAERALALLDALLAASPVGLAFIDPEMRYVRINDALASMNARPVADHLGRTVAEILPEAAPFLEPLLKKVLTTGEAVMNLEFEGAPPSQAAMRSFLASYFPVRTSDGRVHGVGGVVVDITDRKRAAEEKECLVAQLDGERRWLQAVLEQLPAGVIIAEASSGRTVFSNRRAAQILGRTPPADVVPSEVESDASVFDMAGNVVRVDRLPLMRAARGETVTGQDFVVARRDEPSVTVRTNAAPVRDDGGNVMAAIVTFDDITDRRREEEQQRFLAEASKALAESLDQDLALKTIARFAVPHIADWCVIEIAEQGRRPAEPLVVAHVDPAKVEAVRELRRRYPPAPDAPRGVPQVLRTGRSEIYAEIDDAMLEASAYDAEHARLLRELRLCSAMTVPLVARGRTVGAASFVSAESRRRYDDKDLAMAEEFARRAAMAIDNARLLHEANEATRLREEVLAIVSHDLRNPLNSIVVGVSVLAQKVTDASTRGRVELIQRAANRMSNLLRSLLDIASIQAGRLSIETARVPADSLVREAIEINEPLATDKGIALAHEGAMDGIAIYCDRDRLLQVFSNLLGNAIKFCRARESVTVRVAAAAGEVHFAVADTGPGIADSELPHLFEPYWSATRHAKQGTGLGLYIAKGIVEAHGGRIWAESVLGAGSTFHFTIPFAPRS